MRVTIKLDNTKEIIRHALVDEMAVAIATYDKDVITGMFANYEELSPETRAILERSGEKLRDHFKGLDDLI